MAFDADEGTRTPTMLPPLGPEPSASANSATSAGSNLFNTKYFAFNVKKSQMESIPWMLYWVMEILHKGGDGQHDAILPFQWQPNPENRAGHLFNGHDLRVARLAAGLCGHHGDRDG